jgi:O-6-methylguanine DNA methyltransferase
MKNVVKMKNQSFSEKVCEVVRSIPRGKVLSYAQVAVLAGFPGATRAVGTVMKHNFDESVPCHRVVKSTGEVGEYNRGGSEEKRRLLKQEGIEFLADGRVSMR